MWAPFLCTLPPYLKILFMLRVKDRCHEMLHLRYVTKIQIERAVVHTFGDMPRDLSVVRISVCLARPCSCRRGNDPATDASARLCAAWTNVARITVQYCIGDCVTLSRSVGPMRRSKVIYCKSQMLQPSAQPQTVLDCP